MRQMSWWASVIERLTRPKKQTNYLQTAGTSFVIASLCSHGGLQLIRYLLEIQPSTEETV